MSGARPAWRSAVEELRRAGSRSPELRLAVASAALSLRASLSRGGGVSEEWGPLGVRIVLATMRASGACWAGEERVAIVNRSDGPARQRFTVAHEVGHMLLREAFTLRIPAEEDLCDEFASHILIPRDELDHYLEESRGPLTPRDILAVSRHFGTNVKPALIALAERLSDRGQLAVVARRRGHPDRPHVVAYRVDHGAAAPLFLAKHQRLTTVGLVELNRWAEAIPARARHGEASGSDTAVRVGLWTGAGSERRSGVAIGTCTWAAIASGVRDRYVLALVSTEELVRRWYRRRRSA
jgi:hypothetical protein